MYVLEVMNPFPQVRWIRPIVLATFPSLCQVLIFIVCLLRFSLTEPAPSEFNIWLAELFLRHRYPTDLRCGCLQPNVRKDRRIKRALPAHRQDDKDYQVAAFELGHNDEMHHHLKNDRIIDALLSWLWLRRSYEFIWLCLRARRFWSWLLTVAPCPQSQYSLMRSSFAFCIKWEWVRIFYVSSDQGLKFHFGNCCFC